MTATDEAQAGLADFRARLDALDEELVGLLGQRIEIGRAVARHKAAHDVPVMQNDRVAQVHERNQRLAAAANLDPEFLGRLYSLIIDEMCRVEHEVIESG